MNIELNFIEATALCNAILHYTKTVIDIPALDLAALYNISVRIKEETDKIKK